MYEHLTSAFVNAIRKEIRLIEANERAYRTMKNRTFEQLIAHERRGLRLLEIRALLHQLQKSSEAVVSPAQEKKHVMTTNEDQTSTSDTSKNVHQYEPPASFTKKKPYIKPDFRIEKAFATAALG